MTDSEFAGLQRGFAQRLRRLMQLPNRHKGRDFNADTLAEEIEKVLDGKEDVNGLIVRKIPQNDRRMREVMVALNHPLADVPSPLLFGEPFGNDHQRVKRYELIAVLMVKSGFPVELLDDSRRFVRWRFPPTSDFFRSRSTEQLNEQFISCWARRPLCFFSEIGDVRVPNRELRDNLARGNAGMTTEHLLRSEDGPSFEL